MSYLNISHFIPPFQNIAFLNKSSLIKRILSILVGVGMLAIASQLSIPLQPVPLTFQTVTVILIGMMGGARYGVEVIAIYLLAGVCGVPVFANFSAGITEIMGPKGGYLLGFLPAAFISGYLTQKEFANTFINRFFIACLATAIIFISGISVLSVLIGWHHAITFGLLPFIISEPIKLLAISFLKPNYWKNDVS